MIQTTGIESLSGAEPSAAYWAEVPNLREILAGLLETVSPVQEKVIAAADNVGLVALNALDKLAS